MFLNRVGVTTAYARFMRWRIGSEIVILMYHRVSPDHAPWLSQVPLLSPGAFEKHLQYLCSNYEMLSLSDLVQNVFDGKDLRGRRIASITLDDGYKDNFTYAFPLLRKYGTRATIFLTTDPIDSRSLLWWDKIGYALTYTMNRRLSLADLGEHKIGNTIQRRTVANKIIRRLKEIPEERKSSLIEDLILQSGVEFSAEPVEQAMMTWEDVQVMHSNGISFGAHSVSHPILTKMAIDRAASEIRDSKSRIENCIGQRVEFFAYPNGDFDPRIAKVVEDCGFTGAVTTQPVWITSATNRFTLGRVGLWGDYDAFKVMLSGIS